MELLEELFVAWFDRRPLWVLLDMDISLDGVEALEPIEPIKMSRLIMAALDPDADDDGSVDMDMADDGRSWNTTRWLLLLRDNGEEDIGMSWTSLRR